MRLLSILALLCVVSSLYSERKRIPYPFQVSPKDGSFCDRPELSGWLEVYKRTVCFPKDFPDRKEGVMGPEPAQVSP